MIKVARFKIPFLWSVGSIPTSRTIFIFFCEHYEVRAFARICSLAGGRLAFYIRESVRPDAPQCIRPKIMTAHIEIHDLVQLRAYLASGGPLGHLVVQGIDITDVSAVLCARDVAGLVLLGCDIPRGFASDLSCGGAVIFPKLTGRPFDPYRNRLYGPDDLFEGFEPSRPESYAQTPDAQIYAHYMQTGKAEPPSIMEALARRLHDFSITDAISGLIEGSDPAKRVAIMGGHNLARGADDYRAVALMARALARRGYMLLSGGGPGAMEATHLGAGLAQTRDSDLDAAIEILATAPSYKDKFWLSRAYEVMDRFELTGDHLAIPTWLYGHEPPTPFAPHIAKYFANSVREDGLLTLAVGGIIFAPGNAGTIQEIFQDLTQNHYATAGTRSPMVFFNRDYWRKTRPVYPVVKGYAKGLSYADMITAKNDWEDAVKFIQTHPPRRAQA